MNILELAWNTKALAESGCSDGNCRISFRRRGMHTNAGCHCVDNLRTAAPQLADAVIEMAKVLNSIRNTVYRHIDPSCGCAICLADNLVTKLGITTEGE